MNQSYKKILVTGATGFVGKTFLPALAEADLYDIAILVRSVDKAKALFGALIDRLTVISISERWDEAVKSFNPDTVIHLATFFSSKSDSETAEKIIGSNILFGTQLLEIVSQTDCRCFINTGTFYEYQYGDGQFKASNLYSASKTAFRSIIKFYQDCADFKWINVIVYSPYGRYNSQKKIIDHMVNALDAPTPVPFSLGEQVLDFIHVDDIASFFITLLDRLPALAEDFYEFHLGTGHGHSLREVAQVIERVFRRKLNAQWGGLPYRSNDIMHAVAPIARNIDLLKWRSRISLEQGLTILRDDLLTKVKSGGVNY